MTPIKLHIIRHWPAGLADRLEQVWLDLIGFIPSYKLYDLQQVLAEFGLHLVVYEGQAPRWRHVKTGGVYRILTVGRDEATGAEVVVYQSEHNGEVWVRPHAEFHDGRFVPAE